MALIPLFEPNSAPIAIRSLLPLKQVSLLSLFIMHDCGDIRITTPPALPFEQGLFHHVLKSVASLLN